MNQRYACKYEKGVNLKNYINIKKIVFGILILAAFLLVVLLLFYSKYYKDRQNAIVLKTQYTFSVRIDSDGNVIDDDQSIENTDESGNKLEFGNVGIEQIAQIWIKQFTNQFEQKYISMSKAISGVDISKIQVLNASENNVLIAFSCEPRSNVTDYFSSWDGYLTEGTLVCEWVIQFQVEDLYDNTARIFAKSIQLPQEYGLTTSTFKATSTEKQTKLNPANSQNASGSNLYTYGIKDQKLVVTFDGGEKWSSVPVDIGNLTLDKNILPDGSYQVGLEKSAFLYGGNIVSGKTIPLTIIYTNDKGVNWTSTLITDITGVNFYYINFINQKEGFIVVTYNKKDDEETTMIFKTTDGGEYWIKVGSGQINNIVSGVNFINAKVGYVGYEYMNGMESNLYCTTDGGVSFTPVILGSQQFEDTNTKLSWNSVYKDVQVPTLNDDGVLTLIVSQGSTGDYNGGDTVAKYQSSDNGVTWKYMGEQ